MAVSDYRIMDRFPTLSAEELEAHLRRYDRLEECRDPIGLGMHCAAAFEQLIATADRHRLALLQMEKREERLRAYIARMREIAKDDFHWAASSVRIDMSNDLTTILEETDGG